MTHLLVMSENMMVVEASLNCNLTLLDREEGLDIGLR